MRLRLAAMLLLLPVTVWAADRPLVVELFTSQGCSSCPPADDLLTEIATTRADVLPLAFHVTYWNGLGWRDPFSLDAATRRQEAHARRLGGGIYTPELVVEGRTGVVGSDRGAVGAAMTAAARTAVTAATITATRSPTGIRIALGPGSGRGRLLLVGYDGSQRTSVGRGENRGRTLLESNVVRSIETIGTWSGAAAELTVPVPLGEDAALLVEGEDGTILGAARVAR